MTYLTLTNDERKGEYSGPTEYQIGLDELLKAQRMYPNIINYYEQELTNGTITKEAYEEKIGEVNKFLENKKKAFELMKQKIPASSFDVTGNLLKVNERLKRSEAGEEAGEEAVAGGGKRKSKGNSKKVAKKPVASQKKQSIYKEILGKQMKIYKMPDSRKEYVKYKGELLHISDYKDLMKQKAIAKTKTKTKATQQKAKSKTKK